MSHITPFLALVIAGFGVLMVALAWGQFQTSRPPVRSTQASTDRSI